MPTPTRWTVAIPLLLSWLYIILCPYTKVEESFALQATHDILNHGVLDVSQYDHFAFPGVVPRTFIGPLVLAASSWPFLLIKQGLMKVFVDGVPWWSGVLDQILVRCTLATWFWVAYCRFRGSVSRVYGAQTATALDVLTSIQFHGMYYAGRTLPNTFAFIIVMWGSSYFLLLLKPLSIPSSALRAYRELWLRWMTSALVLFRSELVLLLGPMVVLDLFPRRHQWSAWIQVIRTGLETACLCLLLSLAMDSYFWRKAWTYPEGQVFYFNTILNQSHHWGTHPYHTYFSQHLPKLLGLALPLSLYTLLFHRHSQPSFIGVASVLVVFVGVYSFLPHKEWRFIVYVVPFFNMIGAYGMVQLWRMLDKHVEAKEKEKKLRKVKQKIVQDLKDSNFLENDLKNLMRKQVLFKLLGIGLLLLQWITSCGMVWISSWNYPGGEAIRQLLQKNVVRPGMWVHLDPPTAMSGASLFIQQHPWVTFDKSESVSSYLGFSHRVTAERGPYIGFRRMKAVLGFAGVHLKWPPKEQKKEEQQMRLGPIQFQWRHQLFVLVNQRYQDAFNTTSGFEKENSVEETA